MDWGVETDLEDIWASASPEALDRTVSLARRVLRAPAALVSSPRSTGEAGGNEIVRGQMFVAVSDPAGILATRSWDSESEELPVAATLAAPLRLSSGRGIGTLHVVDTQPRGWGDDAQDVLAELAAGLTRDIELTLEIRRRERVAAGDSRLLEAVDRIPALIFERRKIDAGRSSYTFFGSRKTQLPAVRKMMEGGGAAGDLGFLHRDDRELVRTAILRSNLEETDLDLTFRIKEPDRSIRWLRSQSIVRRDPDGSVRWNGFVFDISDIIAAREEAETARADKDALLDGLGRELRAPFQAISGFAHALETELRPDTVSALAKDIQSAAETLLGAVNRAFARGANGRATEPNDAHSTVDTAPRRGPNDGRSAAPAPGAGRILLADDLDLNRKLIADMLGLEGHVVDSVADGAQAVKAARDGGYDLILMDMVMPVMDGIAATQAIRMLPAPAGHVPIVALTANSSQDQLDEAIKAGMDATLTKPMSVDALNAAVSTWIRGRKAA